MGEWQDIASVPEGIPVETKIDDGLGPRNVQVLTKRGRLWWAGEMYVYYNPTHWRHAPLPPPPKGEEDQTHQRNVGDTE